MIRLACTNCREVLTIDDAFAGGVCRCQHCGTIQTVPATSAANEVAVGGPNLGGGRGGTAFGTALPEGTGLDDLAGAVASSGLSSQRLTRPDPAATKPTTTARPAARRTSPVPLFAVAGGVIVLLLAAVVYLATRTPTAPSTAQQPTANRTVTPPVGPNFCGTPLTGDTIVYLLDRGGATQEVSGALRDATLRSALSLGNGRHFQIVFWDNGTDRAAYPPTSATYATKENVEAARKMIDDVSTFGRSDVLPVLPAVFAEHPDTIVLATAKGWDLDEKWAADVLAARATSLARISTFSLGSAPPPANATPALKTLAERTGGAYVELSDADLSSPGR